MSNIDKILARFISMQADKLVLNVDSPIFIVKEDKKTILFNKPLSSQEFQYIEKEFRDKYKASKEFVFNEITLCTSSNGETLREFSLENKQKKVVKSAFSLNDALNLMLKRKASDLHLSADCVPFMRIDGDITVVEEYNELGEELLQQELFKILPQINKDEFENCNDTDFAYEIVDVGRFRVNMFKDYRGIGAVLRHIPQDILNVDDLKIPLSVVQLCEKPKGLVLVTGPTGSGKSTTLAALINHINETQYKHVITIEDPLEFIHKNKTSLITQREINTHTNSFKRALKAALREDPDVVLVGEMRDLETISIAIETAVTGHLVFGTLHTSTAIGTIDRIIDQFPAGQQAQIRAMLADALIGVISQTLLKRVEGGRVGAYEVMIVTAAVSNLIRESKSFQIATLMQTGKAAGMQLLNTHLAELAYTKTVTTKEALSKAINKEHLKTLMKSKGIPDI